LSSSEGIFIGDLNYCIDIISSGKLYEPNSFFSSEDDNPSIEESSLNHSIGDNLSLIKRGSKRGSAIGSEALKRKSNVHKEVVSWVETFSK
jgi:hypothetical protein